MTPQQVAFIQQILTIVGSVVTAMGWSTPAEVGTWITVIMQAVGPVAALGGLVWTVLTTRKAAIVTAVASMPEVYKVEVTDPTLARNDVTPVNVTIPGQQVGTPRP